MNRLTTTIAIVILIKLLCAQKLWKHAPMSNRAFDGIHDEMFFERVVPLTLDLPNIHPTFPRDNHLISIGVMIAPDLVLTSYNPFRSLLHNRTLFNKMYVCPTEGRNFKNFKSMSMIQQKRKISCGRQVVYLSDKEITDNNLWHGLERLQCPVHDLMVVRIDQEVQFTTWKNYKISDFPGITTVHPGVYFTELAKPNDTLGDRIRFASLGFRNDRHIRRNVRIYKYQYSEGYDPLVDCEEWLPRQWGYFICLMNIENFKGVGSGAILASGEKVFGIGSFALFRGDKGILVFTDVRPYYHLLFKTCTREDEKP